MIILEMLIGWFGLTIAILVWLITALAGWRVFTKAGVPGWMSLIPVLREYKMFQIGWDGRKFLPYLIVVILYGGLEAIAEKAGVLSIWGAAGAVLNIVVIYFEVMMKIKLSQSFGRGRAFGLFLYFLEALGMISLGFGPYEYEGPAE